MDTLHIQSDDGSSVEFIAASGDVLGITVEQYNDTTSIFLTASECNAVVEFLNKHYK